MVREIDSGAILEQESQSEEFKREIQKLADSTNRRYAVNRKVSTSLMVAASLSAAIAVSSFFIGNYKAITNPHKAAAAAALEKEQFLSNKWEESFYLKEKLKSVDTYLGWNMQCGGRNAELLRPEGLVVSKNVNSLVGKLDASMGQIKSDMASNRANSPEIKKMDEYQNKVLDQMLTRIWYSTLTAVVFLAGAGAFSKYGRAAISREHQKKWSELDRKYNNQATRADYRLPK